MRTNRKMRRLLTGLKKPRVFDPRLARLLRAGFVKKHGCTLLKAPAAKSTPYEQAGMDRTGYEAFINHIHTRPFSQAWEYAQRLTQRLKRQPGRFAIIISFDGTEATVRFHRRRRGEPAWLDENLEGYKAEAVAEVDTK